MLISVKNSTELIKAVNTANVTEERVGISLSKGVYEINETLYLSNNIELCGEDGVILKGTKRISLDESVCENGIQVINLEKIGITDTGSFGMGPYYDFWEECDIPKPHMTEYGPSMELYFEERKMNLSRYPKEGSLYIKEALGATHMDAVYEMKEGTAEGVFVPSETDIFDNNNTDNMLLIGYWCSNWASQRHTIVDYDKAAKVIKVNEPYHCFGYMDKGKIPQLLPGSFYILNLLSEVKNPGDWYVDRIENKLYLIPFEGQEYVDIALCENMFEAKNTENITIKNISVFGCRKSAVHFDGCKNVTIDNCRINDVGAWGVILDNCTESTVSHCHVYNTGGGGIACSGGDRNILTPSGNIVKCNMIHNIAYWHKTYLAAIELNGVGVLVTENRIYDVPHFAIVFQGNDHIIEKNDIKNACYESNDAGAIYAGRDYTCRGNVIRYNHIHDLSGGGGHGCIGIYFDDAMSSAEVYGNILANMTFQGIALGGGRDFDIHHNYFYNVKIALGFDNRITYETQGYYQKLIKHLNEVPYRSEIWKNKYPELYNIMEDDVKEPKNNKFYNNTIVGGNGVAMCNKDVEKYFNYYDNTYVSFEDRSRYHLHNDDTYIIAENL